MLELFYNYIKVMMLSSRAQFLEVPSSTIQIYKSLNPQIWAFVNVYIVEQGTSKNLRFQVTF